MNCCLPSDSSGFLCEFAGRQGTIQLIHQQGWQSLLPVWWKVQRERVEQSVSWFQEAPCSCCNLLLNRLNAQNQPGFKMLSLGATIATIDIKSFMVNRFQFLLLLVHLLTKWPQRKFSKEVMFHVLWCFQCVGGDMWFQGVLFLNDTRNHTETEKKEISGRFFSTLDSVVFLQLWGNAMNRFYCTNCFRILTWPMASLLNFWGLHI